MRKYLVTSPMFAGEMIFGYDADGVLVYYENNAELLPEHILALSKSFPFTPDDLQKLVKNGKVTEITDLSFEKFWKEYDYKVGNKSLVERTWKKLSESERISVLDRLPKYKYYLSTHQSLEKAYPATFLNQRRWENEFK